MTDLGHFAYNAGPGRWSDSTPYTELADIDKRYWQRIAEEVAIEVARRIDARVQTIRGCDSG